VKVCLYEALFSVRRALLSVYLGSFECTEAFLSMYLGSFEYIFGLF